MDLVILKKRLSSFKSSKGSLSGVSDEVLIDLLCAWENWTGTARAFHTELGLTKMQLGGLMNKAKKLRRAGHMAEGEFKEIKIDSASGQIVEHGACSGMELIWNDGRVIRFSQVDLLLDFLKKAA